MQIGDRVRETVSTFPASGSNSGELSEKVTGTVVFIHSKERFYTVEFRFPKGSFRESYLFPERLGR